MINLFDNQDNKSQEIIQGGEAVIKRTNSKMIYPGQIISNSSVDPEGGI